MFNSLHNYVSDMNGSKSTIGHFIISNSLLNFVNHSDVRDDVDNHSDHLPITLNMYIYVPIAKIAASNIRQYLPKPKWFCVDKGMLQNINMNSTSNEFTCNDTHENYKCQIQFLHDHLIHSCMLAAERTIPFTKTDTKQHRNEAAWNEHFSKEFDHALHWHRLYLQHGRLQSVFLFEMRKFTRSIYHKKVKQIDSNQKQIKKTRIAKGFLENRSRDFWSEISKIRRKTHITSHVLLKVSLIMKTFPLVFLVIIKICITLSLLIQLNGQIFNV